MRTARPGSRELDAQHRRMLRDERDSRRSQIFHKAIVAEPARQENRSARLSKRATRSSPIVSASELEEEPSRHPSAFNRYCRNVAGGAAMA